MFDDILKNSKVIQKLPHYISIKEAKSAIPEVADNFDQLKFILSQKTLEKSTFAIYGIIESFRTYGKVIYARIKDYENNQLQIYIRKDICEMSDSSKEFFDCSKRTVPLKYAVGVKPCPGKHRGMWITGFFFKTGTDELTIFAKTLSMNYE